MSAVNHEPLRPYSAHYWRERQRQFRIESERRRRFRRLAFSIVAGLAVVAGLIVAASQAPSDWDHGLREKGTRWIKKLR